LGAQNNIYRNQIKKAQNHTKQVKITSGLIRNKISSEISKICILKPQAAPLPAKISEHVAVIDETIGDTKLLLRQKQRLLCQMKKEKKLIATLQDIVKRLNFEQSAQ